MIGGGQMRYYFHIRDGLDLIPDEEGVECRTMKAVADEANASAHDLANAALRSRSASIPSIEIEDDDGNDVPHAQRAWRN
jgi:hypothetical protein